MPQAKNGEFTGEISSIYDRSRYKFLIDSPFKLSKRCCNVMKKAPIHTYGRQTGRKPMTAQMAEESRLRTSNWVKNGCNGFDMKSPISNPMAFWTEQDILLYIKQYLEVPLKNAWNNIGNPNRRERKKARKYLRRNNYRSTAICSVYGDIVEDRSGTDEVEGQLTISDIKGWEGIKDYDAKGLPLKTTGCSRTGCMFCGYGCHLEKPGEGRFERMKETHPKQYEYIMKSWEEGGLNYKEVIDWINEHGNLTIRY